MAGIQAEVDRVFRMKTRDGCCFLMKVSDVCCAPVVFFFEAKEQLHNKGRSVFNRGGGCFSGCACIPLQRCVTAVDYGPGSIATDSKTVLPFLG